MSYSDSEIIPISAISHHLYCPRQCALIHVEGVFADNDLTIGGNLGHERVDQEAARFEKGKKIETSYRVFSEELGISGIADLVEFPKNGPPYPIDYKHGKIAKWDTHDAQLCAVALCLEEMLDVKISEGAIYHISSKKRREVTFDERLRKTTLQAIEEIRESLQKSFVPVAAYAKICDRCSLLEICMPRLKPKTRNIFQAVDLEDTKDEPS